MPILNMSKKKEGEESKEDVPDELPSLPEENKEDSAGKEVEEKKEEPSEEKKDESKAEAGEEKKEEPSEEKKDEGKELAPDELPPVDDKAISEETGKPDSEEKEKVVEASKPKVDNTKQNPKILDERLYFSKLIKKLNDGVPIEEIEQEIKSKDIIFALNENIENNQKLEDKTVIEGNIKSKISELQQLEKEWSSLKLDIDSKQKRFNEIENKIKEFSDEIKQKFNDIDEIRKQF